MQIQNDYTKIERNWGYFLQFTENEQSTVKLLYMKQGESTSFQYHQCRQEKWYVISGKVLATKGIHTRILRSDETMTIDKIQRHKLEAMEDSIILEISKGYFNEDDITRL